MLFLRDSPSHSINLLQLQVILVTGALKEAEKNDLKYTDIHFGYQVTVDAKHDL